MPQLKLAGDTQLQSHTRHSAASSSLRPRSVGVARALLADAFGWVLHDASEAGRSFYLHMGFDSSPSDPNTLLPRLTDVAAALQG